MQIIDALTMTRKGKVIRCGIGLISGYGWKAFFLEGDKIRPCSREAPTPRDAVFKAALDWAWDGKPTFDDLYNEVALNRWASEIADCI